MLEYLKILVPPARNLSSYKKQFGTAWKPEVVIPKNFRKVGQFKKGDILTVPLDSTGNISISSIFSRRLYRVSSIEGDGRIRLMLAEFQRPELEESPWANLKSCYKISLADKLLMSAIINLNSGL